MKTWRERIAEARERGKFAANDRRLSAWPATCAWGEQVASGVIDLGHDGTNFYDEAVEQQGLEFHQAVFGNDFAEADRLLDAIEDRALELKRLGGETRGAP